MWWRSVVSRAVTAVRRHSSLPGETLVPCLSLLTAGDGHYVEEKVARLLTARLESS